MIDASQYSNAGTLLKPGTYISYNGANCWPYLCNIRLYYQLTIVFEKHRNPCTLLYLVRATAVGEYQLTIDAQAASTASLALWVDNAIVKDSITFPTSTLGNVSIPFSLNSAGTLYPFPIFLF